MKKLIVPVLLALIALLMTPAAQAEGYIRFSLESGFYPEAQLLTITTTMRGAAIYYTTDGSVPDASSTRYTEPIPLGRGDDLPDVLMRITGVSSHEDFVPTADFPTGHVIRAVAIAPWGRSEIISGTFLVGYDRQQLYGDTPVIFLVTDPDHLFDQETGIYVLGQRYENWKKYQTGHVEPWFVTANFTQRGKDWERPVSVAFLDAQGGFTQEMGLRIKGGATRSLNQKSFKLIADRDYGKNTLQYPLFPGGAEKCKSFVLRSGGNDFDHAIIRDPLISRLTRGMRFENQLSRPCIAFLNGEYWGMYTLMEDYSDHYIQYRYGIDNKNVAIVKRGKLEEGEDADLSLFRQAVYAVTMRNMADPEQYAKAAELIDLPSFADQCAVLMYTINTDGMFTDNNWQLWRARQRDETIPQADGKWRMMLFDSEMACGLYDRGRNFSTQNITPILKGAYGELHPARMLTSLMRNPEFKQMLVLACCDVRNLYMAPDRAEALMQEMEAEYLPHLADTLRRYGPTHLQSDPERHLKNEWKMLDTFFGGRYNAFPAVMQEAFGLGKVCSIHIKAEGPGAVYVNGRDVPLTGTARLRYFADYPITAAAKADDGARFLRWEVTRGEPVLSDAECATTALSFDESFTLVAVFE